MIEKNKKNDSPSHFHWDENLIARYDLQGPRYTSYPTALSFEPTSPETRAFALSKSHRDFSVYIHIPFCKVLCYFCACNKKITRNQEVAVRYIDALKQEIKRSQQSLTKKRLKQLHFGGGTPSFLTPEQMRSVFETLRSVFSFEKETEISIEMDPRSISLEDFKAYLELGFNRLSFGVQDFNPKVQKAVNRDQSLDQTSRLLEEAKKRGIQSTHLDFIYGLPHQTCASFLETMKQVLPLKSDRISLFNFAYLPSRFPSQKLIPKETLPSAKEKLQIFKEASNFLCEASYRFIGMDHFALPKDSLSLAQENGTLNRNFQGYTTHGDCDLIGYGASAISQIGNLIIQNEKNHEHYEALIFEGKEASNMGIMRTEEDTQRAFIIKEIICHFKFRYENFQTQFNLHPKEKFASSFESLKPFEKDGILVFSKEGFDITPKGRLFVRLVCMAFDAHLSSAFRERFSKVL